LPIANCRLAISDFGFRLSECGFAASRAESLWLSGRAIYDKSEAMPRRRWRGIASLLFLLDSDGKPEPFRTESGRAAFRKSKSEIRNPKWAIGNRQWF
jgi:hypothetical protein